MAFDGDAELARQLQEEEDRAVAASLQMQNDPTPLPPGGPEFAARLQSTMDTVLRYESELLQAQAWSIMPVDELRGAADEAAAISVRMQEQPPLCAQDALAKELLSWFKAHCFTWVNAPPCDTCGQGTTIMGMVFPTDEELAFGASRVEAYRCSSCRAMTRFPRFNDAGKLLETRRGRCGEFANCFTLCCRALGLDARLVTDWTDHVWTEYFSTAQQRWVHMDSCEAAYDKPLLYEAGWGKQLTYCVAVSKDGVVDVTRRYTAHVDSLERHLVPEPWLVQACHSLTDRLHAGLPPDERAVLQRRDAEEQQQLAAGHGAEVNEALPGRQTGSAEWKASRGEVGNKVNGAQGGTRWRCIKAGPLRDALVRASGENEPSETADKVLEADQHSKWLDFTAGDGQPSWLEIVLAEPRLVTAYSLTSASDAPERDPADFVLEGAMPVGSDAEDSELAWSILDAQEGVTFGRRLQTKRFQVRQPAVCGRLRLTISRVINGSAANSVQLSNLELVLKEVQQSSSPLESDGVQGDAGSIAGKLQGLAVAAQPAHPVTFVHTHAAHAGSIPSSPMDEKTLSLDDMPVRVSVAERIRAEFGKLMAEGGYTPAEAAAAALQAVAGFGS